MKADSKTPSKVSPVPAGSRNSIPDYPRWESIVKGLQYSKLPLVSVNPILKSELYLLRVDPLLVTIVAADSASLLGKARADLKSIVKAKKGFAGINANFFDQFGKPLGVLIVDTERRNPLHSGGKLLTGIFQIRNGIPAIIHRSDFEPEMLSLAVQAGPRVVVAGKAVTVSSPEQKSRRSGVAISSDGAVIFYATSLRFPGTSLVDIQSTLLGSGLGIVDALNLDGGGSSQLYFVKNENQLNDANGDEVFISGGDVIPAALVVVPRAP